MKHKHADLIIAWANGAEVEILTSDGWKKTEHPWWSKNDAYRLIGGEKHDLVINLLVTPSKISIIDESALCFCKPNLVITFDKENGFLKSANIIGEC